MAPTVESLRQGPSQSLLLLRTHRFLAPLTPPPPPTALAALGIETRGHKDVLAKRLRNANARLASPSPSTSPPPPDLAPPTRPRPQGEHYDSFLVFDVEATCEDLQGKLQRLSFQ